MGRSFEVKFEPFYEGVPFEVKFEPFYERLHRCCYLLSYPYLEVRLVSTKVPFKMMRQGKVNKVLIYQMFWKGVATPPPPPLEADKLSEGPQSLPTC